MLGNGKQFGINLEYKIQDKPEGIGQAFVIGEKFIGDDNVALVLGDNILYGYGLTETLKNASKLKNGCQLFGYHVSDPENFGVINFNPEGEPISIEEKPTIPNSNYAVIGLYFFDNQVVEIAKSIGKAVETNMKLQI